jgi:HSP20 family protein|tara:strand:+ start:387 stop:818 length:432 start_codon:yes stop_codon:yes gene_type:complete
MTKHLLGERLFSTDLLFKNFFDTNVGFGSVMDAKPDYPVDVFISDEKLCFDIACVGVDKEQVHVSIEGNTLKVVYNKQLAESDEEEINKNYIHRGVARRSFDMGWKVSPDYNLTKLDATMKDGLLQITVPKTEEAKSKLITIK